MSAALAGQRRHVRGGKPKKIIAPAIFAEDANNAGAAASSNSEPRLIPLMDLDWQDCRWPVEGAGEHMLFCGLSKLPGSSYCAHHFRRSVASAPFLLDAAE